jgi:hypothetical protein
MDYYIDHKPSYSLIIARLSGCEKIVDGGSDRDAGDEQLLFYLIGLNRPLAKHS